MNLSKKIGTLALASAVTLGVCSNTQAQFSGLGLGALSGPQLAVGLAIGIGLFGAVALEAGEGQTTITIPVSETGGGGTPTTTTTTTTTN